MTAFNQNPSSPTLAGRPVYFNLRQFVQENILSSVWIALWMTLLVYATAQVVAAQLRASPALTAVIVIAWIASLAFTAFNQITRQHNAFTLWLRGNLYSSLSNALITLLLLLLLVAALRGFISWAFIYASFTTDPVAARETLRQQEQAGANWGAVRANLRNLLVFRWPRGEDWRLWLIIAWNVALIIPSQFVYRREAFRNSFLRRGLTFAWLVTPIFVFFLLRGFGGTTSIVRQLNPDQAWGGLLLSLIIAIFAIVASFPLGVLLALGTDLYCRRGVDGLFLCRQYIAHDYGRANPPGPRSFFLAPVDYHNRLLFPAFFQGERGRLVQHPLH
jgi:hypothetical protein